ARKLLEAAGYEVLVFHATGVGGRTMESIIESGMVAGVLDVTTTEWADELVGGFLGAGPTRLEAAARLGVPAIVTPGCLDMVNFHGPESVPAKFKGRTFYQHNPQVTLMRTTPEECAELGKIIAEKVNLSKAHVTVLLPKKAISVISAPGQKFHDPVADRILFDSIKTWLRKDIPIIEMDCVINDPAFAEACANALLKNMGRKSVPAACSCDREVAARTTEMCSGTIHRGPPALRPHGRSYGTKRFACSARGNYLLWRAESVSTVI